jgi:pimeloyl-ACP methyl ester carboxylesterase
MMKISINDIVLHYEKCGAGDPLILIGGLTANCREWQRMLPYLEKYFTVYMPENRGAGKTTGWSSDFTIEDMADDIAQFIIELNLNGAYLIGHSMGGAILQRLCVAHPSLIKAAIIVSSFAKFPRASQLYIENTAELLAAGVNIELVLKTICTRLYGNSCLSYDDFMASEFERMLTDPTPQTPEGYLAQVKAIDQFDGRKELSDIQCPVLIVNGTEDLLTPDVHSEELHHRIDRSKLKWIDQCGHMIPQEKPETLVQLAVDFFMMWKNKLA